MRKAWVEDKQRDVSWIGREKLGQGGQGVTRLVEHKETGAEPQGGDECLVQT